MTVVIDASVAVKWLFDEPDSPAAARCLLDEMIAPSIFRIECANAIIRRLRVRQIAKPEAGLLLREIDYMPVALKTFSEADAFALALELAHPVDDCTYLALARERGLQLVTADDTFRRRAADSGFGGHLILLADYASR